MRRAVLIVNAFYIRVDNVNNLDFDIKILISIESSALNNVYDKTCLRKITTIVRLRKQFGLFSKLSF